MVWTSSLRVSSSSSLSAVKPDVRRHGTTTLDPSASLTVQDSSSRFPFTSSQTTVDQAWRTGFCGSSMAKRKEIPPAQQEGWENTKQRVMQAASSILGTTLDVTHEALVLSTELLELAPIPGLQDIAKTLLHIWDSLEDVDICRLQCLHLTERCAYIMLSVRQEIEDAGGLVGEELKFPIQELSQSFRDVFAFLLKQTRRPFLQQYLKRDDVQREIEECHQSLHEALGIFSFSIQIKILKQVQESNVCQEKEAKTILEALGRASPSRQEGRLPKPFPAPMLSDPEVSKQINVSSSPFDELVATQNSIDAAVDAAILRNVLKRTVAAGNDLVMVETLGVERNEIAEAIKSLERALLDHGMKILC